MSLVNAMIQQGATIPEVSEVIRASETLQDRSATEQQVWDAQEVLDNAAAVWLGINPNEED